jgi:hypothetical protein
MPLMQVSDLIELMRLEWAEIPELKLTFWQARVCGTSRAKCANVRWRA